MFRKKAAPPPPVVTSAKEIDMKDFFSKEKQQAAAESPLAKDKDKKKSLKKGAVPPSPLTGGTPKKKPGFADDEDAQEWKPEPPPEDKAMASEDLLIAMRSTPVGMDSLFEALKEKHKSMPKNFDLQKAVEAQGRGGEGTSPKSADGGLASKKPLESPMSGGNPLVDAIKEKHKSLQLKKSESSTPNVSTSAPNSPPNSAGLSGGGVIPVPLVSASVPASPIHLNANANKPISPSSAGSSSSGIPPLPPGKMTITPSNEPVSAPPALPPPSTQTIEGVVQQVVSEKDQEINRLREELEAARKLLVTSAQPPPSQVDTAKKLAPPVQGNLIEEMKKHQSLPRNSPIVTAGKKAPGEGEGGGGDSAPASPSLFRRLSSSLMKSPKSTTTTPVAAVTTTTTTTATATTGESSSAAATSSTTNASGIDPLRIAIAPWLEHDARPPSPASGANASNKQQRAPSPSPSGGAGKDSGKGKTPPGSTSFNNTNKQASAAKEDIDMGQFFTQREASSNGGRASPAGGARAGGDSSSRDADSQEFANPYHNDGTEEGKLEFISKPEVASGTKKKAQGGGKSGWFGGGGLEKESAPSSSSSAATATGASVKAAKAEEKAMKRVQSGRKDDRGVASTTSPSSKHTSARVDYADMFSSSARPSNSLSFNNALPDDEEFANAQEFTFG